MYNLRRLLPMSLFCLLPLAAGCSQTLLQETAQASSFSEWNTSEGMEGRALRSINLNGKDLIFSSSEKSGVQVYNADGSVFAATEFGDVKVLDVASWDNEQVWLSWFDEGDLSLRVSSLHQSHKQGEFVQGMLVPMELDSPISAVCFDPSTISYSEQWDGQWMTLWAITESGTAYQQLLNILDGKVSVKTQRTAAVGEGVVACAVDPEAQQLVFAQQGVGLIALNADAEQDEERRLLLAETDSRYGSVEDVSLWQQRVLATTETGSWMQVSGDWSHLETWSTLDSVTSSVPLMVKQGDQSKALWLVMQDEGDTIWSSSLHQPLPAAAKIIADTRTAVVLPAAQTQPVKSVGDAADDPEIWVNRKRPQDSLILGTDKKAGLWTYDLQGKSRQFLPLGRVNNVDLRYGVQYQGQIIDVAMTTNRTNEDVDILSINDKGDLQLLSASVMDGSLGEPYGGCLQQGDDDHSVLVWVNNKEGVFQQWKVDFSVAPLKSTLQRSFKIASQPEGCVADEANQRLILGEEDYGLWVVDTDFVGEPDLRLIDSVEQGNLVDDVEGVTLYADANGNGYIVVSSQGDNAYVLYDRQTLEYVGRFRVGINGPAGIDGSSETDGLAVTSASLNADYESGLLVVQDGRNRLPTDAQNFKLVSWRAVEKALELTR